MIIKNYVCVDSFIPNLLREKKMLSDLILTDLFFFLVFSFAGKFGNNFFCLWNRGMVSFFFPEFYFKLLSSLYKR